MLKRFAHILLGILLFITLLVNGVAHEYVHLFAGHEDTIDRVTDKEHPGAVAFENMHHHCDFLQFHASAFLTSTCNYSFAPELEHKDAFLTKAVSIPASSPIHTALRGPPMWDNMFKTA